jgi:hypothetical protein
MSFMGFNAISRSTRWIFALICALGALYSSQPIYGQVQSTLQVIPQIADGTFPDGSFYGSEFFVTNLNNAAPVTCTFTPYGVPASRFLELSFTIPTAEAYVTSTTASGSLVTGFATLSCTDTVTVNTVYTYANAAGVVSEATVFSAAPFLKASVAGLQTSKTRIAVAIANNSSVVVDCVVTFKINAGLASKIISIPPYSNVAKFADEIFTGLPSNGPLILYLQANQPLYAIGLMYTGAQFTSIPPTIYN